MAPVFSPLGVVIDIAAPGYDNILVAITEKRKIRLLSELDDAKAAGGIRSPALVSLVGK